MPTPDHPRLTAEASLATLRATPDAEFTTVSGHSTLQAEVYQPDGGEPP